MHLPFPILFILDAETEFVFEKYKTRNFFVKNCKEWDEINKHDLQFCAIVILSEVFWKDRQFPDNYGFDIGLELRRKYKCLLPIIITSAMPQSHFEFRAEKDLKYNLLYARGTIFIHLLEIKGSLENVLKNAAPISLPLLTDMNEMLFNMRGVLSDTLGHRLRAEIEASGYWEVMGEMKLLLNTQQISAINWDYYQEELSKALGDQQKFSALKTEFLNAINRSLAAIYSTESPGDEPSRHRLLLVEDDPVFANQIQLNLSGYFTEIIYTDEANKAMQILADDTGNNIIGLLCDWRLYTGNPRKYWQIQGYEILDYAAKNRYAALFGITSLADSNVHSIRNMLGFEMHLFKKEHFVGTAADIRWKVMTDIILQKCDDVARLLASEPSGLAWQKLKEEYIARRNTGWLSFENEVSREADSVFLFYKEAIEADNSRNVFSINEMGLSLKNNLKNILIIRRIYLGLYFMLSERNHYLQSIYPVSLLGDGEKTDTGLKHHATDAYSIIRKDWWDDIEAGISSTSVSDEWERYEQRQKNFRNTLCIDISVLPKKGLLPEEKTWMLKNKVEYSFLFNYWTDDL